MANREDLEPSKTLCLLDDGYEVHPLVFRKWVLYVDLQGLELGVGHGDLHGEPRVFVLKQGENPVGADPNNAVHLPIRQVSRQHALLRVDGDRVRIEDLGSTNGTKVNGLRIQGEQMLADGDIVSVGSTHLRFEAS